jgi:hypothetical protein
VQPDQAARSLRGVRAASGYDAPAIAKRRLAPPSAQLELAAPSPAPAPSSAPSRPPVMLKLGPRDCTLFVYDRAEDGEPVYRVVKQKIKAASTAGVLARKLLADQERRR